MTITPLDPNWMVEADDEFKGTHPYHDHRYITQGEGDAKIIIARMSDMPQQAQYAHLIETAPKLLRALEELVAQWDKTCEEYTEEHPMCFLQDSDAILAARAAIAEATTQGHIT